MNHIITLEVVIILSMLLVGMIFINIQLMVHELMIPMNMTNLLIAIDFGYYQHGVEPEQPPRSYFPNYGSSSQSSQATHSSDEQFFQPFSLCKLLSRFVCLS